MKHLKKKYCLLTFHKINCNNNNNKYYKIKQI